MIRLVLRPEYTVGVLPGGRAVRRGEVVEVDETQAELLIERIFAYAPEELPDTPSQPKVEEDTGKKTEPVAEPEKKKQADPKKSQPPKKKKDDLKYDLE